jgi:hypothetical protein
MPKIMQIMAKMGLDMVMPILLSPFSTTSAKLCFLRLHISYIGKRTIFKAFGHSINGNFKRGNIINR